MSLSFDKQSHQDLEKEISRFFDIFDQTETSSGSIFLSEIFKTPLNNFHSLNNRISKIRNYSELQLKLLIRDKEISSVEHYLNLSNYTPNKYFLGALHDYLYNGIWKNTNHFYLKINGIQNLVKILREIQRLLETPSKFTIEELEILSNEFDYFARDKKIQRFLGENKAPIKTINFLRIDYFLRNNCVERVRNLIDIIGKIDCFISISNVLREEGFTLPESSKDKNLKLSISDLKTPTVKNHKGYTMEIPHEKNVIFLTGSNMAGKSTFLRTIGSSLYLAHIGFPILAKKFEFKIFDVLHTSINVFDDPLNGKSHFLAELERVKLFASAILNRKSVFVIIDELFKGTNMAESEELGLFTIDKLRQRSESIFFVSSHSIRVARKLSQKGNIEFYSLIHDENNFHILKKGISEETTGKKLFLTSGLEALLLELEKNSTYP